MCRSIRFSRPVISFALAASLSPVASAQQPSSDKSTRQQQQNAPARAATEAYPAGRAEAMAREWTRARDYTGEYLAAMPEDGFAFKPTPEVRSFAEQMLHLANANFMFAAAAIGRANPYQNRDLEKSPELRTKAAVTRVVLESYDFAIGAIKGMTDAKLDESVAIFGRTRPRAGVLAAGFEHQTHHRGQTTVYLRLRGVTPPAEKLF